jgi:formate hydrogenlyase transcriptional activator
LSAAVGSGEFRRDLFYRLNVFPIHVPPLRERRDDILLLAKYFVARYAATAHKKIRSVDKDTAQLLEAYHWPGNIRELQNVIQRAVILCESDVFCVEEAWFQSTSGSRHSTLPPHSVEEKARIEEALEESRGRISGARGAAARLGIPRTTLEAKIKRLAINKYEYHILRY